jgi:hypothetical protein
LTSAVGLRPGHTGDHEHPPATQANPRPGPAVPRSRRRVLHSDTACPPVAHGVSYVRVGRVVRSRRVSRTFGMAEFYVRGARVMRSGRACHAFGTRVSCAQAGCVVRSGRGWWGFVGPFAGGSGVLAGASGALSWGLLDQSALLVLHRVFPYRYSSGSAPSSVSVSVDRVPDLPPARDDVVLPRRK